MAFLASGSDLTWQKYVQLAVSEDDTLVAKRAFASTGVSCAVEDNEYEPRSVTGI